MLGTRARNCHIPRQQNPLRTLHPLQTLHFDMILSHKIGSNRSLRIRVSILCTLVMNCLIYKWHYFYSTTEGDTHPLRTLHFLAYYFFLNFDLSYLAYLSLNHHSIYFPCRSIIHQ